MLVEWICDCCGGYETDDTSVRVGAEDRCDDCADHTQHCDEYRALNLRATDWTETPLGRIACVERAELTRPVNVGDNVVIDGDVYQVTNIESTRILTYPPIDGPSVGLMVRPHRVGGE